MNTKNKSEVSQKCEHTPMPWRIGDAGTSIFGPPNGNPAPHLIASMMRGTPRQDAQFICKAVNCHEELVTACKVALAKFSEMGCEHDDDKPRSECHVCLLRAAITKAESL